MGNGSRPLIKAQELVLLYQFFATGLSDLYLYHMLHFYGTYSMKWPIFPNVNFQNAPFWLKQCLPVSCSEESGALMNVVYHCKHQKIMKINY